MVWELEFYIKRSKVVWEFDLLRSAGELIYIYVKGIYRCNLDLTFGSGALVHSRPICNFFFCLGQFVKKKVVINK